jgi:hypothetical protein
MYVLSVPLGRLGNAIFRHFASVLFSVLYGAKRIQRLEDLTSKPTTITDEIFLQWMAAAQQKPPILDVNATYAFFGYFQHDTIFLQYRDAILEYMRHNPEELLITDGKTERRPDFNYLPVAYKTQDLMTMPPNLRRYEVVVHVRLEDFVDNGQAIHPDSVVELLRRIKAPTYCVVVAPPKKDVEKAYIRYLHDRLTIVVESNDVLTDFHIMKHATTLICSKSTISWAAAFMSDTIKTVYMPHIPNRQPHETFHQPVPNTLTYTYLTCSLDTLNALLFKQSPLRQSTAAEIDLYQQRGFLPTVSSWTLNTKAQEIAILTQETALIASIHSLYIHIHDEQSKIMIDYYMSANGFKHTQVALDAQGTGIVLYSRSLPTPLPEQPAQFDVVIPVGPKDISVIHKQLEYTKKNIVGRRTIYIVSSVFRNDIEGVIFVPESVFPFSLSDVAKRHGKSDRNGWYLQQLLKLYAGLYIPGILPHYLVLDSDTFFIKPTTFMDADNKPLFNSADENHAPYMAHMERLHPSFVRKDNISGISHHMLFTTDYVKELMGLVEQHHQNKPFWQVFLDEVSSDNMFYSGASEYELYFHYMKNNHPNVFRHRLLRFKNTDQLINDPTYDYISVHWYIREQSIERMNIVLVHLGPTLPPYVMECIRQIRRTMPTPIHMIVNQSNCSTLRNLIEDVANVDIIATERVPQTPVHIEFLKTCTLQQGFWKSTSERFFYIYDYCLWRNMFNILHLENDNLVYADLTKYLPQFLTKPFWAVFDAETRCIPSVVFIRHPKVMDTLMTLFVESARRNENDMTTLAKFRKLYSEHIGALPIIANYKEPIHSRYTEHAQLFGALFDGAAVGQYLGGIDTLHNKGNSDGFINETTVFQCDKVHLEWRQGVPYMNNYPLVNLHIHSKDLQRWCSNKEEEIITGEKIQELCHVYCGLPEVFQYNPRIAKQTQKHLDLRTIVQPWNNPELIFCSGHVLTLFMEKQHFFQNPFVLVSHNSDENITDQYLPILRNPKLKQWYAQNIYIDHHSLKLLPIGIANSMWPHGNLTTLTAHMRYTQKSKDIYFYFNICAMTQQARSECYTAFTQKGLTFGQPRPYPEYLAYLAQHKFAICPDGNGADSHRIWECYYLGVIPILKANIFTRKLQQWLPCIVADSWDAVDLQGCLQVYDTLYAELQQKTTALRMPVFAEKLQSGLKMKHVQ